jgi:hypothetical protein
MKEKGGEGEGRGQQPRSKLSSRWVHKWSFAVKGGVCIKHGAKGKGTAKVQMMQ